MNTRFSFLLWNLFVILWIPGRVNARCTLQFDVGCYREVAKLWITFCNDHFPNWTKYREADHPLRVAQEPHVDHVVKHSVIVRKPGAIKTICSIRLGLQECLKKEGIEYAARNQQAPACYNELLIEVHLSAIAEMILGSHFDRGMDPYSLWTALEPYCDSTLAADATCIADTWPSEFKKFWNSQPVTAASDDTDSVAALCNDARVHRVIEPFDSLKRCVDQPMELCRSLETNARKLHWILKYPEAQHHCTLRMNCIACPKLTALRENLRNLSQSWLQRYNADDMVHQFIRYQKQWCQLYNDTLHALETSGYYTAFHKARNVETKSNSRSVQHNCPPVSYARDLSIIHEFFKDVTLLEDQGTYSSLIPATAESLLEISNNTCHKKILPDCFVRSRLNLTSTYASRFREMQQNSAETAASICEVIEEIILEFVVSLIHNCGRFTAAMGCRVLLIELHEHLIAYRFHAHCAIVCQVIEQKAIPLVGQHMLNSGDSYSRTININTGALSRTGFVIACIVAWHFTHYVI